MPTDQRPKAYLGNRLYVPDELIRRPHLQAYTYLFGSKESSDPEDYIEVRTYREFSSGHTGFARGNLPKIQKVFGREFRIIDQRCLVPHRYDLQFTGTLSTEQLRVWSEWLDYQYGTIEAPPRWGKSAMAIYMLTRLRQRSLLLAQEISLVDQFEEEMRSFTNIDELERKHATRLIGRPKKSQDVMPILTCATWQSYDANLAKLRQNRDAWGAVFVDEAHSASAPCFARVVNTTNSYYRIALTATPERKDGQHVVMFDVCGPVVAKGRTEQLPVHVRLIKTDVKLPPTRLLGNKFWNYVLRHLMRHERRNEMICRRVLADAYNGHSVLVVTDRIPHIMMLVSRLRELDAARMLRTGRSALVVAPLYGGVKGKDRKELRHRAKARQIRIVVAYSKIVQLGWNVPAWSSLHSTMPMSNAPNWYQRISRIRTKCANCPGVDNSDCLKKGLCQKKQPVCSIYVDDFRISQGCLKTQHEVHERLGFVEQTEYESVETQIKRDPNRKGKMIQWNELT